MKQLLFKNRIRGVSFRRSQGSRVSKGRLTPQAVISLSHDEILRGRPSALTPQKINQLLADPQRHELHLLVSECIDHVTHWKQLTQALDTYISGVRVQLELETSLKADDSQAALVNEDSLAFAVEVRSNYLFWKHRLSVLELIAEAQPFLGLDHFLKQKERTL